MFDFIHSLLFRILKPPSNPETAIRFLLKFYFEPIGSEGLNSQMSMNRDIFYKL
jgi:hypothetical protein